MAGATKENQVTGCRELTIEDRKLTIDTTFYPDKNPPQTCFRVSGDLQNTHIPGGVGGLKVGSSPAVVVENLVKELPDLMNNFLNHNDLSYS